MKNIILSTLLFLLFSHAFANTKPNIIVVLTDDISARELPIYGSSRWTPPLGGSTSDPRYRANTPIIDMMATEGCYIETTWAATVCSPSRAMVMTGRYAHLHKWWGNGDIGRYVDPADGRRKTIPLYASSPRTIAHIAKEGGYDSYWAGKTQMRGADIGLFGFDEGVFTAGGENVSGENPFTDFELANVNGVLTNLDSGNPVGGNDTSTYAQRSWYWKTSASTMRRNNSGQMVYNWWPRRRRDINNYSENTYGPDVELDLIFDFMERKVNADKPFFVYHTSHLGHDAFDFLKDGSPSRWPGTPKVNWDGTRYTRTTPNITRNANGTYNTNNSITENGIHHHVNYLDYQMSLYLDKLKELGIEDNTLIIFTSDNGTSGYGKNSVTGQRGTHVPFIIYGPGLNLTKRGKQDVLFNMADILPTIAEIGGVEIPCDYEINGESFWPFLTTNKANHRDWIYAYRTDQQLIRDQRVMIDGREDVYDVRRLPADISSFTRVARDLNTRLSNVNLEQSRNNLMAILPLFSRDNHDRDGLPDPAVNGSRNNCNTPNPTNPEITISFDGIPSSNNIDTNASLESPINFTINNIPNNTATSINLRIYANSQDVTRGNFVSQFPGGANFNINSATQDINNSILETTTQINTPSNGFISRSFSIKKVNLRNGQTINPSEEYIVALRFIQAGATGNTPLTFSNSQGIQSTTGGGNIRNVVFELDNLTATSLTLGGNNFQNKNISQSNYFVYPNLASTVIYVTKNSAIKTYSVYSLTGEKVIASQANGPIDISTLANGIYFLVTEMGTTKFVKQ